LGLDDQAAAKIASGLAEGLAIWRRPAEQ
jgi:hypothetical protein